jgi:HK97 family phage major capsid protein
MFVEKTTSELEAMTPEQLDSYKAELKAHQKTELSNEIKAVVETAKANLESFLGNEINAQLAEKGNKEVPTLKSVVEKFISENAEKITSIRKAGSGSIELEVDKAVIETANATLPVAAPALQGVQVAPPSRANFRTAVINSMVTTIPTTQASYAYTETLPLSGDFGFVAEKGTKPNIDMKFETRYAAPLKVAAHMVLTEEAVQDIPNLQAIAYDFLRQKHDLKREKGLLLGDGISPNPKGATVYGRAFSAGPLALAVTTPNFMDVVNACITDIYTTHNFTDEMPYMANIVLVNPNDFFVQLVSAKDLNGLPLYPSASLFNQVNIGGVTIMPHEDIVAGKIFVADLSKYNTTDYMGYTVKIGWINDDFIKNQFCIVGESRFHAFVKKLDEQAFIYDTIATIKTAITKA